MTWKTDPRYLRWKKTVNTWQKMHMADVPMPITPSELRELEEIFPASMHFTVQNTAHPDDLSRAGEPDIVYVFGDPHFSQKFVVAHGIRPETDKS